MNYFEPNEIKPIRLLKTGRAPLLLATRIIPASAMTDAEQETANTAAGNSTLAAAAPAAGSKNKKPTVKLLGIIKGVVIAETPAEQSAPSRRCVKCRSSLELRRKETRCPRCRLAARHKKLIKNKQLSIGAWERIGCALLLSAEIEKTPTGKCRALFHLLNIFVKQFNFEEQNRMTDEDIKNRPEEPPDLPPVFAELLEGNNQTDGNGSSRQLKSETSGNSNKSTPRPKRRPVSVARFLEVVARQGSSCFWCGIRVVRVAQIPQKNRLATKDSKIVYRSSNGETRREAVGTVDHLVRVTDGGDNSLENLVISCYPCNVERDNKTQSYIHSVAGNRISCATCGGRFFYPDWGCCSICGAIPEEPKKSWSLFRYVVESLLEILKKRFGK